MNRKEATKAARARVGDNLRLEVKRLPALRPGAYCRACGTKDCGHRFENRIVQRTSIGPFGAMVLGSGHSWEDAIAKAERLVAS